MTTPVSSLSAVTSNKNDLILKSLDYAVFRAPLTVPAVTGTTLFDATTGKLLPNLFSAGQYVPVGFISDAGNTFARSITKEEITAMQSLAPVRSDPTGDVTTMKYEPMETTWLNIATYIGVDPASLTSTPNAGGAISVDQSATGSFGACRWLAIAYDSARDIYVAKHFPNGAVDATDNQVFAKTGTVGYPVTVKAYFDTTEGTDVRWLYGGAGWLSRLDEIGLNGAIPVISTVTPSSLAVAGGTLVTIKGQSFTGATAVTFAGTAATSFNVIDAATISAVAPAHTAGSALAVVVTTPAGSSVGGPTVTYA